MTQDQQLQSLVLKSEGRSLEDELKFGAQIMFKSGGVTKFYTFIKATKRKTYLFGCCDGNNKINQIMARCFNVHELLRGETNYSLVGLPLTLERILMALGNKLGVTSMAFNKDWLTTDEFDWRLGKSALEQTTETKKLITLLS